MWLKQHKSTMTRNGDHTTYKNGDDWGIVYDCFALLKWICLSLLEVHPLVPSNSLVSKMNFPKQKWVRQVRETWVPTGVNRVFVIPGSLWSSPSSCNLVQIGRNVNDIQRDVFSECGSSQQIIIQCSPWTMAMIKLIIAVEQQGTDPKRFWPSIFIGFHRETYWFSLDFIGRPIGEIWWTCQCPNPGSTKTRCKLPAWSHLGTWQASCSAMATPLGCEMIAGTQKAWWNVGNDFVSLQIQVIYVNHVNQSWLNWMRFNIVAHGL